VGMTRKTKSKETHAFAIATGKQAAVKRFSKAFFDFADTLGCQPKGQFLKHHQEDFSQANLACAGAATLVDVLAFLGVPPYPSQKWMNGVDVVFDFDDVEQVLRLRKEDDPADEAGTTARLGAPKPTLEVFRHWMDVLNHNLPPIEGLPILFEMLLKSVSPEDRLLLFHAIAHQHDELPNWTPLPEVVSKLEKWDKIKPNIREDLWDDGCWAAGEVCSGASLSPEASAAVAWIELLVLSVVVKPGKATGRRRVPP